MNTLRDPEQTNKIPETVTHHPMLINGQWVEALSGRVFETRNPATGVLLGTVADGDAADVDLAVRAARAAFSGPWSRFTPYDRQMLLLRIADLVESHFDELAMSDTRDMGTPVSRTRANRSRILGMLRFYAGQATAIHGQTIANSMPGAPVSYTLREPVGVVGAIIPWNAPMAATVWKIAPALATGCTVVLKPAEDASLTPLLMARLMLEAGVPPGVVNIVTGSGGAAGAAIAAHHDVDKVAFTGSHATGQKIVQASAGNLKRLSLELGGKSANIVFADADYEKAVPGAAMAVFANSGQICIAGSRLFVERPIYDDFVAQVAAYGRRLTIGDGAREDTDLGPLVSATQLSRVSSYLATGEAEGARLVSGGRRVVEGGCAHGYFVEPTVFADVTDDMTIAREEIFGPVIAALPFDSVDEVIERANRSVFGLAGGVWTRDVGKAHKVAGGLRTGSVWVNTYHALDPAVPFGGIKMSGYGREGGAEHLDEYLQTKSVWMATQ